MPTQFLTYETRIRSPANARQGSTMRFHPESFEEEAFQFPRESRPLATLKRPVLLSTQEDTRHAQCFQGDERGEKGAVNLVGKWGVCGHRCVTWRCSLCQHASSA